MPTEADWPVDTAVQALADAGWQADTAEALQEALSEPNVGPVAARHWVRLSTEAGDWGCVGQLDALLERGAVGRAALEGYVQACGLHRQAGRLAECVGRYREALRGGTRAWGTVGYAYAHLEDYAAVCEWLGDWQTREGLQPWMLTNLVLALRAGGRCAEANAVSRHAVSLPRDPDATLSPRLAGIRRGSGGPRRRGAALARRHRTRRTGSDAPVHPRPGRGAGRGAECRCGKWAAFAAARRLLAAAAKSCSPLEEDARVVRVAYRGAVTRMGKDGGALARLWALWRRLRPLLPTRALTSASQGK